MTSILTSPWEHVQSYEGYEDYDAWLQDSDGLGVLLRLTLIPEEQRAYMSLRVLDENGNDYADHSHSIAVQWDAAVRMSGYRPPST